MKNYDVKQSPNIELDMPGKVQIIGDVMIRFNYSGVLAVEELFRVQFNPAFVGADNVLDLGLKDICPEKIHKEDSMFPRDFRVQFYFDDENCEGGCNSATTHVDDTCQSCIDKMGVEYFTWVTNTKYAAERP